MYLCKMITQVERYGVLMLFHYIFSVHPWEKNSIVWDRLAEMTDTYGNRIAGSEALEKVTKER